jgi:hypothetical protein
MAIEVVPFTHPSLECRACDQPAEVAMRAHEAPTMYWCKKHARIYALVMNLLEEGYQKHTVPKIKAREAEKSA